MAGEGRAQLIATPLHRSGQYDHHCILVAHGTPCRIIQVKAARIMVECEQGCCCGFTEICATDFEAYYATAVMNDFANALSAD